MNSKKIMFALLVSILLPFTTNTWAAVKFWKNSVVNGNWNTGSNWSAVSAAGNDNGGVPVGNEPVRIVNTDGTARTVTLDTSTPSLGLFTIDLTGAGTTTNTLALAANNTLTASGIFVGGYNGVSPTNGRGAVTQSAGTISTASGVDWVFGHGAGSTGTYTLSGTGAVVASQSEFIGYNGTGTFIHSAGTNTINAGAIGGFFLGDLSGSHGTYNLSGTGQLISNKSEFIGDQGTGVFNHSGGTNTIVGAGHGLTLGNSGTGVGTYTASGTASLVVPGDLTVGLNGAGTLNVQGNANVNIGGALNIGAFDTVNLSGGTLRFSSYNKNLYGNFNYSGGTIQLPDDRTLSSDALINTFFGTPTTIPSGKGLTVEGIATIPSGSSVSVNGGSLKTIGRFVVSKDSNSMSTLNITSGATVTSDEVRLASNTNYGQSTVPLATVNVSGLGTIWNTGELEVGSGGVASLNITNGGTVVSSNTTVAFGSVPGYEPCTITVSGLGSSLTTNDELYVGLDGTATLTIDNGGVVYVTTELSVGASSAINLNGGTIRFNTFTRFDSNPNYTGQFNYSAGTIQLAGARGIGTDAIIEEHYGTLPVIPTGKGLTIEGVATLTKPLTIAGGTFKTNGLAIASGGGLDFDRGIFELSGGTLTGLSQLNIPTNGEYRDNGVRVLRIAGAAGSLITATGNLTIGNAGAVNGFYTDGTLNVGANIVTLNDANDAAFDTGALATLGNAASPGTLSAANGLTLDFGGNITGFGTVSTPNNIAKPLNNNGHITGSSVAQPITLPGYVKGVGTLDNVNLTGTFSPGLSPTSLSVGNLALAPTSTLIMELGGTAPGSGFDQILSAGLLGLDGTLEVSLINSFTPASGQSYNLFDWVTESGTFDTLNLPTLTGGLSWNTSHLYSTGVLSIGTGLSADFDDDGDVDGRDFLVWQRNPSVGNLTDWQSQYGMGVGSPAPTRSVGRAPVNTVPEPSALSLLLFVALPFLRRH